VKTNTTKHNVSLFVFSHCKSGESGVERRDEALDKAFGQMRNGKVREIQAFELGDLSAQQHAVGMMKRDLQRTADTKHKHNEMQNKNTTKQTSPVSMMCASTPRAQQSHVRESVGTI
jgi:hypothetical protein